MYQEILDTNGMMLLFLFYLPRSQLRLDENVSRYFFRILKNQSQKFDSKVGCKVFLPEHVLGWEFN